MTFIKLNIFFAIASILCVSFAITLDVNIVFENNEFSKLFKESVKAKSINISVTPADVFFMFYNDQTIDEGTRIELTDFNGEVPGFDPSLNTFFVTHGSTSNYNTVKAIKDRILAKQNANVFLIDWDKHSHLFYTISVLSVPKLGEVMGDAIKKVRGIDFSKVTLIGHSLGAHVIGAIGATLNGQINCISGMDPAGLLFQNEVNVDKQLDVTDAQFVQIIHANGGFQGIRKAIGHADYFPNGGGMNQPGCGSDLFGACAHGRAMAYFRESVLTGGFIGRACTSYKDYKEGLCKDNATAYFGELTIDKTYGTFYFDTNPQEPYAVGHC